MTVDALQERVSDLGGNAWLDLGGGNGVLVTQGDGPEALAAYRRSLAIQELLAARACP